MIHSSMQVKQQDFNSIIRYILMITLIGISSLQSYAQPSFDWVQQFKGTGNVERGRAVAVDEAENVYTIGYFKRTTDFDPGPGTFNLTSTGDSQDIFLTKFDYSGKLIWANHFGTTSSGDFGYDITVGPAGNIFITGQFVGTIDFDPGPGTLNLTSLSQSTFIVKFDPTCHPVWAKHFEGYNAGHAIHVDDIGNVYTTGEFNSGDFDPGPGEFNLTGTGFKDVFVSKLNSNGEFVWAKHLEGFNAYSIGVDGSGNVITTGYFDDVRDFDPGPGVFNLSATGTFNTDVFVSKLDINGDFVWAKELGGTSAEQGWSLDIDPSDNIYLTGRYSGTADFDPGAGVFNLPTTSNEAIFVTKLSNAGNLIWAIGIPGTGDQWGFGLDLDASNNVYVTGYFGGTADFDPGAGTTNLTSAGGVDAFIAKYDMNANFEWAVGFGGNILNPDLAYGIAVDASRNVYTTGYFNSQTDFDPGPGTFNLSPNSEDVFVHKLSQSTAFGDCPPVVHVSTDPIMDNTYTAGNVITSTSTINSPHNIVFEAGHSIYINGDFEVKTGASFLATIEDCVTALAKEETSKVLEHLKN